MLNCSATATEPAGWFEEYANSVRLTSLVPASIAFPSRWLWVAALTVNSALPLPSGGVAGPAT